MTGHGPGRTERLPLHSQAMGLGEVVGGVALVGVIGMFGLALTDDGSDDSLATEPAATLGPAPSGAEVTPTGAPEGTAAAPAPTPESAATTPASSDAPVTTSASTDPPDETDATVTSTTARATTTTARPTTTTVPATTTTGAADVRTIAVQVLDAGRAGGAAEDVTGALRATGFEPVEPQDAVSDVGWSLILYAAGHYTDAVAVNQVVGGDPALIVPAVAGDANWQEFGDELDVLVLLGAD